MLHVLVELSGEWHLDSGHVIEMKAEDLVARKPNDETLNFFKTRSF